MSSDCGWRLAAAVSNAGALGTIGSLGRTPANLRDEIRQCRAATDRPFAVNIACFQWAGFAGELLGVAIEEDVPAVTLSFGDVMPALRRSRAAGVRVTVQVQTIAAARVVLAERPDLLIVQGHEAGGHTGTRGTLSFAAQALGIAGGTPVAVAGGIGNGRGLAGVLAMGAAAAVIGTRFKATPEFGPLSNLDAEQKAALVESDGDDTVHGAITDIAIGMTWPPGIAGRVLRNRFTTDWLGRENELRQAVAARPEPYGWTSQHNQDQDTVLNWAGESAGLIDRVRPAAEIVEETVRDAESLLRVVADLTT
ncbi:MAG: nitronate monooxygenase [Dehalococcoidia bacterium]|nr:nitronate monooxygenase [Dehalococcoidia bacterium]MCB9484554.1 nitronate monooxygenase [Thermoflexaceae bacterium]